MPHPLPIDPLLPRLFDALRTHGVAVLQAPAGAGKTTRVPLALLEQPWLPGHTIIVVEPQDLAARAAANRMAALLGEAVGGTVGCRTRQDERIGARTRIEVTTDDLFLRRIQESPALPDVGAVLFDEVHERRINGALALAFAREAREALCRGTLLLAMSATMDAGPLSRRLGNGNAPIPAPIVTAGEEPPFAVEARHLGAPAPGTPVAEAVAAAVCRALREEPGGVLAFLPDGGTVRRVQDLLDRADLGPAVILAPLCDDATEEALDAAIAPAPPGRRKVVLATALAETGLAIDGVRIVVDGGLVRVPRFDPRIGMTRSVTVPVSQAAAERRRGRAGRREPGVCYRLWPEAAHRALDPCTRPEILDADLAPLALELAAWGVKDAADLPWLDAPPPAAMARARDLLTGLGAIDAGGAITPLGTRMATLGLHPRLARLMLSGADMALGAIAGTVAALLEESDDAADAEPSAEPGAGIWQGLGGADLRLWTDRMLDAECGTRTAGPGTTLDTIPGTALDESSTGRILWRAQAWRRRIGIHHPPDDADRHGVGRLLALAYPDRIARRQSGPAADGGTTRYRLPDGRSAGLPSTEPLSAAEWLAVVALDGGPGTWRIALAAPTAAPMATPIAPAGPAETTGDDVKVFPAG